MSRRPEADTVKDNVKAEVAAVLALKPVYDRLEKQQRDVFINKMLQFKNYILKTCASASSKCGSAEQKGLVRLLKNMCVILNEKKLLENQEPFNVFKQIDRLSYSSKHEAWLQALAALVLTIAVIIIAWRFVDEAVITVGHVVAFSMAAGAATFLAGVVLGGDYSGSGGEYVSSWPVRLMALLMIALSLAAVVFTLQPLDVLLKLAVVMEFLSIVFVLILPPILRLRSINPTSLKQECMANMCSENCLEGLLRIWMKSCRKQSC